MRPAALLLALCSCASPKGPIEQAERAMRNARVQKGQLELLCEPKDAEISIDGVPQGTCADYAGTGLRVGQGLKRIEVKKPGYWPYQTYYEAGGARAVLTVTLSKQAP